MAKASKKISRITVVADVEHDANLNIEDNVTICHPDDTFRKIKFIDKVAKTVPKRERKKKSKGLTKADIEQLNSEMKKIYAKCKNSKWKKIRYNVLTGEPSTKSNAAMGYESFNKCVKNLKEFGYANKSVPIGGKKK